MRQKDSDQSAPYVLLCSLALPSGIQEGSSEPG